MKPKKAYIGATISVELASRLRLAAVERTNAEGRFVGMSRLVEEALRQYFGGHTEPSVAARAPGADQRSFRCARCRDTGRMAFLDACGEVDMDVCDCVLDADEVRP